MRWTLLPILSLLACTSVQGSAPEVGSAWSASRLVPGATLAPFGAGESFGQRVALAGDVDADGYDDVLVGDQGAAWLFQGTGSGVSTSGRALSTSGWPTEVAGAGDVNGDGHADVILGDPGAEEALVYLGGPSGLDQASEQVLTPSLGLAAQFGYQVAPAGDVDGDGYDDVAVGACDHFERGEVHVFLGSAHGVLQETELVRKAGVGCETWFACSLSNGAGDLDGDGYDDLVVGAGGDSTLHSDHGAFYVFAGEAGGLGSEPTGFIHSDDPRGGDYFSWALAVAGDLDGDGYDDVVASSEDVDDGGHGHYPVYVYYGSPSGLDATSEDKLLRPSSYGRFGMEALFGAGDVDGDGYDDLLVGDRYDSDYGTCSGAAWVLPGSASGVARTGWAKLTVAGSVEQDGVGMRVSGAGDVDGDGLGDVILGSASGTAHVFRGDATATSYADADGDGYGDPAVSQEAEEAPAGWVSDATDCDDTRASVHPGATEVCDALDDDCNGLVDDDDPDLDLSTASDWYADADADGFGDPAQAVRACEAPAGRISDATDCDDGDAAVHPGATEICDDGLDQDCDTLDPECEDEEDPEDEPEGSEEGCSGCSAASPLGLAWLLVLLPISVRRRGR